MKVKNCFILKDMGEFFIVVATGEEIKNYNCMITLNSTAVMLWKMLEKGAEKEQLIKALLDNFVVDEKTASEHIEAFIKKLSDANILE